MTGEGRVGNTSMATARAGEVGAVVRRRGAGTHLGDGKPRAGDPVGHKTEEEEEADEAEHGRELDAHEEVPEFGQAQ
jgi:hypothetical protein